MPRRFFALVFALAACRSGGAAAPSEPAPSPIPPTSPSGAPDADGIPPVEGPQCDGVDLDVVAACLRHAMRLVAPEEPFDELLEDAATTGMLDARCVEFLGADGMRTASGARLAVTTESSDWDHLDDGTARRYLDVRVGCSCCAEVTAFSVTVTVGGGTP